MFAKILIEITSKNIVIYIIEAYFDEKPIQIISNS